MRRNLFIILGFGETNETPGYISLKAAAESAGYSAVVVSVHWDYSTIEHWRNEVRAIIFKNFKKGDRILGFSFGAMLAIEMAKEFSFDKIFLCSLSPYYGDDIKHIPNETKKFFGKRRMAAFSHTIFPVNINTQAVFFFGTSDWPYALEKIRERAVMWRGRSRILYIEGVGHDVSDSRYLAEIIKHF